METEVLKLVSHIESIGKEFKKSILSSSVDCSIRDIKILENLIKEKKTMSELADLLEITKGSMTNAIDSLIIKKFVKREYDKDDRRKVYIVILNKGELIVNLMFKKYVEVAEKILKILDINEKKQFMEIMNKISLELK